MPTRAASGGVPAGTGSGSTVGWAALSLLIALVGPGCGRSEPPTRRAPPADAASDPLPGDPANGDALGDPTGGDPCASGSCTCGVGPACTLGTICDGTRCVPNTCGDRFCQPGQGLVAYWPFEDGAGSAATDLSGNQHAATPVGTPTQVAGHAGNAIGLSGTTSWVEAPDAAALRLPGVFSIEAWARVTTYGSYRVIVDKSMAGAFEYWLGYDPSDRPCILVNRDASGGRLDVCGTTAVTDQAWHHLVGRYDGTDVRIYLDGTLAGPAAVFAGTFYAADGPVRIGHSAFWDYNPWDGDIDEVRIYDRALSATEIQSPDAPRP